MSLLCSKVAKILRISATVNLTSPLGIVFRSLPFSFFLPVFSACIFSIHQLLFVGSVAIRRIFVGNLFSFCNIFWVGLKMAFCNLFLNLDGGVVSDFL